MPLVLCRTGSIILPAVGVCTVWNRFCCSRGALHLEPVLTRPLILWLTDSLLAWHYKKNGPLHEGMSKLIMPEEAGARFVSFPWLAYLLEFRARKNHQKHHTLLKAHVEDPTKKPPPGGFFYSTTLNNRTRLLRNEATARAKAASEKLTADARDRKRTERANIWAAKKASRTKVTGEDPKVTSSEDDEASADPEDHVKSSSETDEVCHACALKRALTLLLMSATAANCKEIHSKPKSGSE